jgi:hypothetical protein
LYCCDLWRDYICFVTFAWSGSLKTIRLRVAVVPGLSAGDGAALLAQLAGSNRLRSRCIAPDRRVDGYYANDLFPLRLLSGIGSFGCVQSSGCLAVVEGEFRNAEGIAPP